MDARTVAAASNAFGFSLTQAQERAGENLFLSPLSVFLALAMTANGATPETRKALFRGLHLPDTLTQNNQGCAALLTALRQPEPKVSLELANALWAFAPHAFAPNVVQQCQTAFGADLRQVTLENAVPQINGWAAQKTHNLVREVVRQGDFSQLTTFALSNVTYFKGAWTTAFDPAKTQLLPFHRTDGTTRRVPMLTGKIPVGLAVERDFQVAKLPYGTGRFQLYAILPAPRQSVARVLAALPAFWESLYWQRGRPLFREMIARVVFPKLTLDLPRWDLAKTLHQLKMLGPNDVSLLEKNGKLGALHISNVFHKTHLEIDEAGTRAAATTVVVATRKGLGEEWPLNFDRPFVLCLVEEKSRAILFTGVVNDPGG